MHLHLPQEQADHLGKLVKGGDFPHLLVYGPPGAGKKTRVMCLLREMYGAGVERLRIEHQSFLTPSKKKVEITTIASNYHIEVNPSDCGIYDRVVIQELIKTVASAHQLNTEGQREFKVVVLTEVDKLTKDAQHALRRTMEKHMATCRVILVTNSTSKVRSKLISSGLARSWFVAPCTLDCTLDCTIATLHPCNPACTIASLQSCTLAPSQSCTLAPLHPGTLAPWHPPPPVPEAS